MAATIHPSLLVSAPADSRVTLHKKHKAKEISVIGSLKICRNLEELKQTHGNIIKTGLIQSPSAVNKLIAACAELATFESLDYAIKGFEIFQKEGVGDSLFMVNALIRGFASAGIGDEAILLYHRVLSEGLVPDHFTFPFLLSACTKIAAFNEGVQMHGSVVKIGLQEDIFIQNSLIHLYFECGDVDSAQKIFDGMSERNVVSWTSLICGYVRRDHHREAVSLFFEMIETGVRPNSITMSCVVSACAKLQDFNLGERVCAYICESRIELNAVLVNALVDMYMKCGARETAERLFHECNDKNLVLYNTMMSNYEQQGLATEALAILGEMLRFGLLPDRVTMLAVILASAQLGNLILGKEGHGYVLRNGLEGWHAVNNAIIDMYMKCGDPKTACRAFNLMSNKTVVSWNSIIAGFVRNDDLESAWRVFNEMPNSDLVSWNTIIRALVQESQFVEAIELFREMQIEGMKADRVTMVSVVSACGYLGAYDLAKWAHAYIQKNSIGCDARLSTALVDMYARCGDPQSSMQVFNEIGGRDVSAWTTAIGAMAVVGNGERAIELFEEMLRQGVKPDAIAFVAVLTGCSHGGLVDQGWRLFRSMKDIHGISPQVVHYGCMVDLLGRAGLLEEACDLIKSMPIEPNDIIWGTLLAACRTHNNVELATYAAERVSELAPEKSGIHVLLSNVYASARKWTNVATVRMHLKEKGVRKVPGSSSTEVNGTIHEFTATDDSHPQMKLIAEMLHEINCRIKEAGHIPDLANVLLDVDEQEKEYLLNRHSEKLAMAFGLISTNHGVPIRVVKNLRMCTDCHSFAKLVSEIYDREIIIRDNNRFHFFRRGSCSCHDYW